MVLVAAALLPSSGQGYEAVTSPVHPINADHLTDPNQFAFLAPSLKDIEVVSLGESMHLTREFPLVRLGIIRYLHQNLEFSVLAMEGSAEDIWVAQDRLLNSSRSTQDIDQALSGLFSVWNTSEVRQLYEYEVASWNSSLPFYITAYDIQPGTGMGSHGGKIFGLLKERLASYGPPPIGFDSDQWMADLQPITGACGQYRPSDSVRVESAIKTLDQWISEVAPRTEKLFPGLPHARVLRMIPANMRASLQLCQDLGQGHFDWRSYKTLRDIHASQYALQLKAAAPGQRLILWAHLSHLFYNSEHSGTSVGEMLRRALGPRLYTIMPFAESGFTIQIYSDVNDDIAYGWVHGRGGRLGDQLSRLGKQDYFLDLRGQGNLGQEDSLFSKPEPIWVESGQWSLALARDFDGILWIKTVHAPHMLSGRLSWLILLSTVLHYRTTLISLGVLFFGGLVARVLFRWRKRRKARYECGGCKAVLRGPAGRNV